VVLFGLMSTRIRGEHEKLHVSARVPELTPTLSWSPAGTGRKCSVSVSALARTTRR
jgi:hypothetical protein